MSGPSPKPRKSRMRSGAGDGQLNVVSDLVGVQRSAVRTLEIGNELNVRIIERDGFAAVVCETSAGSVVGSLAGVPGLSQLIGSIKSGKSYVAIVEEVSPTHCVVAISEVTK